MFDKKRLQLFEELENYVFENQLPIHRQANLTYEEWSWTADYWTIEVCKCLRLGNEAYLATPPPEWLKGNPLFGSRHGKHRKYHIVEVSDYKRGELLAFKEVRNLADNLFITQIGWGLSVIVASQAGKPWGKISGYDHVPNYGPLINAFFEKHLSMSIDFETMSTEDFEFDTIDKDTILAAHASRKIIEQVERINSLPKIKAFIYDGGICKPASS